MAVLLSYMLASFLRNCYCKEQSCKGKNRKRVEKGYLGIFMGWRNKKKMSSDFLILSEFRFYFGLNIKSFLPFRVGPASSPSLDKLVAKAPCGIIRFKICLSKCVKQLLYFLKLKTTFPRKILYLLIQEVRYITKFYFSLGAYLSIFFCNHT